MGIRTHKFVEGEFYHIYIHGVGDLKIFKSAKDYQRFLSLLFAANGKQPILRLERGDGLSLAWDMRDGKIDLGEPLVDIVSFSLMPTHFHLLLMERGDSNISKYLHKILTSHSKYFNLKYERRGHLFESKFNSKHVSDNDYLLILSSYIHKNSKDLREWQGREDNYKWSSYQDFILNNRWSKLLASDIVMKQFKNKKDYKRFVDEHYQDLPQGSLGA